MLHFVEAMLVVAITLLGMGCGGIVWVARYGFKVGKKDGQVESSLKTSEALVKDALSECANLAAKLQEAIDDITELRINEGQRDVMIREMWSDFPTIKEQIATLKQKTKHLSTDQFRAVRPSWTNEGGNGEDDT